MSANPERHTPKGSYVVLAHDGHADALVGHYISHSRARKAARIKARGAAGSQVFCVYDDAGQCRLRISHDDLPGTRRGPSCAASLPAALPLAGAQRLAPLTWKDGPTWLSLPLLLGLAAFDFWHKATLFNHTLYPGNAILRQLGMPDFPGLALISLALFYFLPLWLWLVHARGGLGWKNARAGMGLLRWVLGGLVMGSGLGLLLAVALASLFGQDLDADPWPLLAASVTTVQIPYYLWVRRQPA